MSHQASSSAPLGNIATSTKECSSDDEADVLDGVFVGPMNTDAEKARIRALLDALAQEDEQEDSLKSSEPSVLSQGGSPIDGGSVGNDVTGVHAIIS